MFNRAREGLAAGAPTPLALGLNRSIMSRLDAPAQQTESHGHIFTPYRNEIGLSFLTSPGFDLDFPR